MKLEIFFVFSQKIVIMMGFKQLNAFNINKIIFTSITMKVFAHKPIKAMNYFRVSFLAMEHTFWPSSMFWAVLTFIDSLEHALCIFVQKIP